MLILFSICLSGTRNIEKIKEKKEKHTWSCQIMDELLQRASIYEYDRTGKKPLASQHCRDEEARPENVFLSDAKQNDNTGGMKQNENKKGSISYLPCCLILRHNTATTSTNCLICAEVQPERITSNKKESRPALKANAEKEKEKGKRKNPVLL